MIRRGQINAGLRRQRRSLGAGPRGRARDAVWALADRGFWPVVDRLQPAFDVLRWPFERAAWAAERGVLWPTGDRLAKWGVSGRTVALGGAGLLAAGALALGAIRVASEGGEEPALVAAPARAQVEKRATPEPEPAPVLEGAVPDFTPQDDGGAPKVVETDAAIASDPDAPTSSDASSPPATLSSVAGETGEVEDPGPAAIDVARRFSGAFVLYETGRSNAKVRAILDETASPRLTKALLRRPPRLPADVEVPQAKVLNVVPGPRQGSTFTLSASLLRVGVTSELRIDVQRDRTSGQWQVTDVLG